MKYLIKAKPVFIGLILCFFSLTAQADVYYWQWATNIFDRAEVKYRDLFYPPQNTNIEYGSEGILYYRFYNTGNGVAVYETNNSGQHVYVYSGELEEWLYLNTLDKTDLMVCPYSCRPSPNDDDSSSGDEWWNNPDYPAGWCYGNGCSWNYSTHDCECY